MDTRDFFPKSTPSHWYCLPLLSSIPEESRASFLADLVPIDKFYDGVLSKGIHQNGTLILSKWNTHIIKRNTPIKKGTPIKMEPSYYQNGTH